MNALKSVEPTQGLILIQIDGLSHDLFKKALADNRMPFLKSQIDSDSYTIQHMYSGVPSTTPAVQGELFYGIRCAVPAFSFRDSVSSTLGRMFDPPFATMVQQRLEKTGRPLLRNGVSYSNIYGGGAETARFCPGSFDWNAVLTRFEWLSSLAIIMLHPVSILRIVGLLILEIAIALGDWARGIYIGASLFKETKFILSRVVICIFLRELITIFACRDARNGTRRIHLNFLGYDEQAHRRGPSSTFALWTLKGIDDCIKRIWKASTRANQSYEVWVYSDHGQEQVIPYEDIQGCTIQETIRESLGAVVSETAHAAHATGISSQRVNWLRRKPGTVTESTLDPNAVEVAAMGPLGHVYGLSNMSNQELLSLARTLVTDGNVPLVLLPGHIPGPLAVTRSGVFELAEDSVAVAGENHPYRTEVQRDLIGLCAHQDSGQIILSGYCPGVPPVSFPREHGAHAGHGPSETDAFICAPSHRSIAPTGDQRIVRPLDFRSSIQEYLGDSPDEAEDNGSDVLRVTTYNIRSCLGADGSVSPDRIVHILKDFESDFIALQELDCRSSRSGNLDQLHRIAEQLHMKSFFLPTIAANGLTYGIGILSRYPCTIIKAELLARHGAPRKRERRAAILARITFNGRYIYLLNTHLSLYPRERLLQIKELLSPEWLGRLSRNDCIVLCGDLNAASRSRVYRLLSRRLTDVQIAEHLDAPRPTWPTRYPFRRIDHIFISNNLTPVAVRVPLDKLIRVASDHAPVVAALRVTS